MKLINQLVLNKECANVGKIDVAKDTSYDFSWLLLDDLWNNLALNVHHVIGKVSFDEGLHNRSLRLFLDKHLNHLHYLIVGPLPPQVIPPLFMLCLARYLLGRGVIATLLGRHHDHAVGLLISNWNVWNIFEWGWTFIEWIVHCTLDHGRSLLITLKDQSGIV